TNLQRTAKGKLSQASRDASKSRSHNRSPLWPNNQSSDDVALERRYYKSFAAMKEGMFCAHHQAVIWQAVGRWTSAAELACSSGIGQVMERNGQSVWVGWRYFCPRFMRQIGVPGG